MNKHPIKKIMIKIMTLPRARFLFSAFFILPSAFFILPLQARAQSRHSPSSRFLSYEGKVMCGYQGWFRAAGDGSGAGWVHYCVRGKFTPETLHLDLWPDVSEYKK